MNSFDIRKQILDQLSGDLGRSIAQPFAPKPPAPQMPAETPMEQAPMHGSEPSPEELELLLSQEDEEFRPGQGSIPLLGSN